MRSQIALIVLVVFCSGCTASAWNSIAAGLAQGTRSNSVAGNARSTSHNCPSCGSTMMWTGATKTEWAKLYNLYRCVSGHEYWYESFPSKNTRNIAVKDPCPICGLTTMWTGDTRIEWGKMQNIHKCINGHISVKVPR